MGAVIIKDKKILLEKRRNQPGKGKWSIPGGLVELGESTAQTVIREVKEETGLNVEKPRYLDIVEKIVRDKRGHIEYHFIIVDYFVDLKNGALQVGSDAEELEWVGLDEVESYDLTKTFRDFFARYRLELEKIKHL